MHHVGACVHSHCVEWHADLLKNPYRSLSRILPPARHNRDLLVAKGDPLTPWQPTPMQGQARVEDRQGGLVRNPP